MFLYLRRLSVTHWSFVEEGINSDVYSGVGDQGVKLMSEHSLVLGPLGLFSTGLRTGCL